MTGILETQHFILTHDNRYVKDTPAGVLNGSTTYTACLTTLDFRFD